MFPDDIIESVNIAEDIESTGIDFIFNYETGQHYIKDSLIVECSIFQSVMQYIQDILRTPKDMYSVYIEGEKESFGISVYKYLGKRNLPIGYINSELKREVTELALKHPYITNISQWECKRMHKGLEVSFAVALKDESIIKISEILEGLYI